MASQGYYNQGPQYPQQRCVVSLCPALSARDRYANPALVKEPRGLHRSKAKLRLTLFSHLVMAVDTLSKATLPSNMVDITKVLLWVPQYLYSLISPHTLGPWRQAYHCDHLDLVSQKEPI